MEENYGNYNPSDDVKERNLQEECVYYCSKWYGDQCLRNKLFHPYTDVPIDVSKLDLQQVHKETKRVSKNVKRLRKEYCKVREKVTQEHKQLEDTIFFSAFFNEKPNYINDFEKEKEKEFRKRLGELFDASVWTTHMNHNSYRNLSSHILTKEEMLVLGLGSNFKVVEPTVDSEPEATDLHNFKSQRGTGKYESDVCGIVQEALTQLPCRTNIPYWILTALWGLKANKDIHVTKDELSNSIVILDKAVYNESVSQSLRNNSIYRHKCKKTANNEKRNIDQRMKMLLDNEPGLSYDDLKVSNHSTPYMYGLVQTCSDASLQSPPLRLSVNYEDSVSYKLLRKLEELLVKVIDERSHNCNHNITYVSDPLDMIKHLKNHSENSANYLLVNFNAIHLLKSVQDVMDLKETLQKHNLPTSIDTFMKLIYLCITCRCFYFNTEYYEQCDALVLGNPLLPILAKLYAELYFIRFWRLSTTNGARCLIWDNEILLLLPKDTDHSYALNNLTYIVGSENMKILAREGEVLNVLDISMKMSECGLKFRTSKKATTMLDHFLSGYPTGKRKSLKEMFVKVHHICDTEYRDEEISILESHAIRLCYPRHVITKCKHGAELMESRQHTQTLPLNIKESDTIWDMLQNHDKDKEKGTLYCIPCGNCEKIYIGQTILSLDRRLQSHRKDLKKNALNTAILSHVAKYKHVINWERARVVCETSSTFERYMMETILINNTRKYNMNKRDGNFKEASKNYASFRKHKVKKAITHCKEVAGI